MHFRLTFYHPSTSIAHFSLFHSFFGMTEKWSAKGQILNNCTEAKDKRWDFTFTTRLHDSQGWGEYSGL